MTVVTADEQGTQETSDLGLGLVCFRSVITRSLSTSTIILNYLYHGRVVL